MSAAGRCAAPGRKEAASPPLTFTRLPRPGPGTRRARVRDRPSASRPAVTAGPPRTVKLPGTCTRQARP